MKLSILMTVNALVAVLFTVGTLFAPELMLELYGAKTINSELTLMTQFFGSGLFCYAVLTWFARNAGPSEARRAIILGLMASYFVGMIITGIGYFSAILNMFALLNIGLYVLFLLSYGYFLFASSETES